MWRYNATSEVGLARHPVLQLNIRHRVVCGDNSTSEVGSARHPVLILDTLSDTEYVQV